MQNDSNRNTIVFIVLAVAIMLAYQWLVISKNRLGDAIAAHAITNFLLGLWVVGGGAWHAVRNIACDGSGRVVVIYQCRVATPRFLSHSRAFPSTCAAFLSFS